MPISGPELIIVLIIVLVLFGGAKLPQLARSIGEAQREFKRGMDEGKDDPNNKSEDKSNSEDSSNSNAS